MGFLDTGWVIQHAWIAQKFWTRRLYISCCKFFYRVSFQGEFCDLIIFKVIVQGIGLLPVYHSLTREVTKCWKRNHTLQVRYYNVKVSHAICFLVLRAWEATSSFLLLLSIAHHLDGILLIIDIILHFSTVCSDLRWERSGNECNNNINCPRQQSCSFHILFV